jgi:hypothetical protein
MIFTAQQLDMAPTGSLLEWRIFDDGFISDPYRIVLLGPKQWQLIDDEGSVGTYRSLKTAFASAEHFHRERLRRRSVRTNAVVLAIATGAWLGVDALFPIAGPGLWILVLFPIVFVGMASLVRCVAATSGNVNNPYIAMPYNPRPRWRRLLFGR